MPIIRDWLVPTLQAQPVVAPPKRRKNMAESEFYQNPGQASVQQERQDVPKFVTPAVATADEVKQRLQSIAQRSQPPQLDPASRVRTPQVTDTGSAFQKYYDQLSSVGRIGTELTAAESAKAMFGKLQGYQNANAYSYNPIGNSSGGGSNSVGTGYADKSVASKGTPPQVAAWISQAASILKQATGYGMTSEEAYYVGQLIKHESGGNPNAQNNWDSNAKKGTPSIGLMQTIGPTFNAHKLPGYDNIRDPIANILAGVRYGIKRYGSILNIPGIKSLRSGGGYKPY